MAIVFLAFGANLGDREANIREALVRLTSGGLKVLKMSSIRETSPLGGPPQGPYLNAVAKAETGLDPFGLLAICQKTEADLGRVRTVFNGPRTIDIDILFYDNLVISTSDLSIPHPRMWQRDFVMVPLAEIAPELVK